MVWIYDMENEYRTKIKLTKSAVSAAEKYFIAFMFVSIQPFVDLPRWSSLE